MDSFLHVAGLTTQAFQGGRRFNVVDNVSFDVAKGEAFGIVGESGSGKTMLALSLTGYPPQPLTSITAGRVQLDGQDVLPPHRRPGMLGRKIGVIFESAGASLDPCFRVGSQIAEMVTFHERATSETARARAVELLGLVGIPDPGGAFDAWPHQFSGGMQQRVGIAIALACRPQLLIADSPTSALDVTIQAQILKLLSDLQKTFSLTLVWITHNVGLLAQIADRIAVLRQGRFLEIGETEQIVNNPRHPYSASLIRLAKMGARSGRVEPLANADVAEMALCRPAENHDHPKLRVKRDSAGLEIST